MWKISIEKLYKYLSSNRARDHQSLVQHLVQRLQLLKGSRLREIQLTGSQEKRSNHWCTCPSLDDVQDSHFTGPAAVCRVCQKRKNYLLLQGLPKKKKLFVAKKLFRAWSVPCEQAVEQSIASLAKSTPPKSMDSAVVIQSVTHGIPSSGFSNLMGGDLWKKM